MGFDSADEIDEFFQDLMQKVDESYDNLAQQGLTQIDNYITYLNTVENTWFDNSTENAEYELEKEYFEEDFIDADENEEIEEARDELHDVEKANESYLEDIVLEALDDGSKSFQNFLEDVDEGEENKMEEVDDVWHNFLDAYEDNTEEIYDLKEDLLGDLEEAMDNIFQLIDESVEHMEEDEYYDYIEHSQTQAEDDLDDSYLFEQSTLSLDDYPDHWIAGSQDPDELQYSEPLMETLSNVYNIHDIDSYTDQKSGKRQEIYKQKFIQLMPPQIKNKIQHYTKRNRLEHLNKIKKNSKATKKHQ